MIYLKNHQGHQSAIYLIIIFLNLLLHILLFTDLFYNFILRISQNELF
jgi:hypothetical protein